jgi:hypothetical protein
VCCCNQFGFACSLQFVSSQIQTENIAAPGEAFNTVWYVEQIAHAALAMNVSISAGCTESAMSYSDVRIMVPKT